MYFLGGSANWGNIRGILTHNMTNMEIYEEGDFSSQREDVWGISDYHLVEEAHQVLRVQKKPFLAFIHTAGNHRPYTIPRERGDFQVLDMDVVKLREGGFDAADDYNGIRFEDYALGHFFDLASKEDYCKNTVFCMFADHGTTATGQLPWDQIFLTNFHIPFAIYAPGYISEGRRIDATGSLVDVLPTALSLIGVPYTNRTLGRRLLTERPPEERFAFISRGAWMNGLLEDELYLLMGPGDKQCLYPYRSDTPLEDLADRHPDRVARMARLCRAIYQTSKYMLYHNAPNRTPGPEHAAVEPSRSAAVRSQLGAVLIE